MNEQRLRSPGVAFLLSQLGGHSSRLWVTRLAKVGLDAREVMLFRHIALSEGRSQRELSLAVGLPPSRLVAIVDRLEARGWIERRTNRRDRRAHALHLTAKGRATLRQIMAVSAEHEADLTAGLDVSQRESLIDLLQRVADHQGLVEGVHPGFADERADQTREAPDDRQVL
jgi:DNA-binding MarR family transcriptional regulator